MRVVEQIQEKSIQVEWDLPLSFKDFSLQILSWTKKDFFSGYERSRLRIRSSNYSDSFFTSLRKHFFNSHQKDCCSYFSFVPFSLKTSKPPNSGE